MTLPELVYSENRRRATWREALDGDLLSAISQDDELALDELVRRKTQPLLQLAFRVLGDAEEAKDVVQMGFLRIWQNRHKFDPRWSPNTWIYRIVTNLAIDHLRSRQRRERSAEPIQYHLRGAQEASHGRHASDLRQREVMGIFRELASGLTEKQRVVFVLREVEGLNSREVAAIVGCRESTVRNHLFNARKYLRRELLHRYPEYAREASDRGWEASQ